jgi:Domain of unknown function (DUF397)
VGDSRRREVIGDPDVSWRQSSFCLGSGCVEVAVSDDCVGVRDSKVSGGAALSFDREEWRVFVAGVKAGEFDA